MAILLTDELRLFYAVVLIVVPYVAGYRLSRRFISDRLTSAATAFVFFHTIQYLSVCLPGVAHQLNSITIAATALALSFGLLLIARRSTASASPPQSRAASDQLAFTASLTFVLTYLAALAYHQAFFPMTSTDALTYHAPAAVQWLQTHRLGIYETWFFNPANSYSPLAGSTFIAFLIAPLGNDVLARFVGVIPLIFLFIAMTDFLRRLDIRLAIASIIAAAAVLARPFISQSIVAKDDLFVAAFFIATLNAMMMPADKRNPLAPIIAGLSLGLLLATKYTSLYALPIILLMIDAPLRKGWRGRDYAVAALITFAVASPWYARNWVVTGNPLYPTDVRLFGFTLFRGMFQIQRSRLLESPRGVWNVFTANYFSAPLFINIALMITWVAAVGLSFRRLRKHPLHRAILLGPPLVILLFAATSPYGEFRFAYPALILLFASIALVVMSLPAIMQLPLAVAFAILSAATAFRPAMTAQFILAAVAINGVAILLMSRWVPRIVRKVMIVAGAFGLVTAVYIYWHAYIAAYRDVGTYVSWSAPTLYGAQADLWRFVRDELPRDATVAYTNTYLTYPLTGFTHNDRVLYVPARKNINSLIDLPRIADPLTGEDIAVRMVQLLHGEPDRAQWLNRLKKSGANYLVISAVNAVDGSENPIPPEQDFASSDPAHFERVYPTRSDARAAGLIYRIR